jgi:hypothetical protein
MESVDPMRQNPRSDIVEPKFAASRTEIVDPHLAMP